MILGLIAHHCKDLKTIKMKNLLLLIALTIIIACGTNNEKHAVEAEVEAPVKKQRPVALDNGKFFEVDGVKMLYGGTDSTEHFDITGYTLKDEQFHYGIGREVFPALLEPQFISVQDADSNWADSTRFLVAFAGDEVKAYSVPDLTHHEVVNDVLNGEPIMAVYCILADLGAIYDRKYGDKVLTFALSGYTYYDEQVWDGLDGFVLWDRETESLWWPLIDKAVSGRLKGVELLEKDKTSWKDTTWGAIKEHYPNAMVLQSDQDFERPKTWNTYEDVTDIVEEFSSER
jgi:hypothetical protein